MGEILKWALIGLIIGSCFTIGIKTINFIWPDAPVRIEVKESSQIGIKNQAFWNRSV